MRIKSLEIRDMWSYQQDHNRLEEFGQTTIIIGANNSGKSNILKAIRLICNSNWRNAKSFVPPAHTEHQYPSEGPTPRSGLSMSVTLLDTRVDEILRNEFAKLYSEHGDTQSVFAKELNRGFELEADTEWSADDFKKQSFKIAGRGAAGAYPALPKGVSPVQTAIKAWQNAFPRLQQVVCAELTSSVCFIPENRRVSDQCFEGMNITKFLEQCRSSGDPTAREKKRVFDRIQARFKQLLKDPIAALDPVAGGGDANLERHHQLLPLGQHGGGLPHLLRMAGEFSRNHNSIILLEEPELGLNPELQRELVQHITNDTSNQYIITTHSSVFMDAGLAETVYRIEYDGMRSKVHLCKTKGDLHTVLQLLGTRPSDILQANVIIWVEGITDQYFLERCFELKKATIRRGIDYAFAYLDDPVHATLCPTNARDYELNLLDFSSRVAVVCDSDKTTEEARVDDDKERLRLECKKQGAFFWLTAGYEIENYFRDDLLTRALRDLKKNDPGLEVRLGRYERLGDQVTVGRKKTFFSRILREMRAKHLQQYDLNEKLDELINYISPT